MKKYVYSHVTINQDSLTSRTMNVPFISYDSYKA